MISFGPCLFSEGSDGDIKGDPSALIDLAKSAGIPDQWATVRQVHGAVIVKAIEPGTLGDADAIYTAVEGLPVAVFTADCAAVVLESRSAVGVAHAGWRGARDLVAGKLRAQMEAEGHSVKRAILGPMIGSCCFEVGPEVAEQFPGFATRTTWGTGSVDLAGAIVSQLDGLEIERLEGCTMHESSWFSHRRDADARRMAAVVWRPS